MLPPDGPTVRTHHPSEVVPPTEAATPAKASPAPLMTRPQPPSQLHAGPLRNRRSTRTCPCFPFAAAKQPNRQLRLTPATQHGHSTEPPSHAPPLPTPRATPAHIHQQQQQLSVMSRTSAQQQQHHHPDVNRALPPHAPSSDGSPSPTRTHVRTSDTRPTDPRHPTRTNHHVPHDP